MKSESLSRHIQRLQFIRWESLRRNKEFRKFYYKDYLPWLNSGLATPENIKAKISQYNLISQFDVPHPDTPFKMLKEKKIFRVAPLQCGTREATFVAIKADGSNWKEAWGSYQEIPGDQLADTETLQVVVNLAYPKQVLLKAFGELVTKWTKRKKDYGKHTKKTSISDLKEYFKAFDLKTENPNMTYRAMAKIIFKKKEPLRNDEKKAENYYKEAKRLISQAVRIAN